MRGISKVLKKTWLHVFEELKTSEVTVCVKEMVMWSKVGPAGKSAMRRRLVRQGKMFLIYAESVGSQ